MSRGPAPKDPNKRIRRNKTTVDSVVQVTPAQQPALEDIEPLNPLTGKDWTDATLDFWESLADFPTLQLLVDAQWALLARAMRIDDAISRGNLSPNQSALLMAELRLQLSPFGITPSDVLRLRMSFAQADIVEDKASRRKEISSSRDRRASLTVVQDVSGE